MVATFKALMVILTAGALGLAGCAGRAPKEPAKAALQTEAIMTNWTIEHIFHYKEPKLWGQGHAHYMFHDRTGHRIFFDYFNRWIGQLGPEDTFVWTAGMPANVQTGFHIAADFVRPIFLADPGDGTYLVACDGNARIFRLNPNAKTASLFLDLRALGGKDVSACVLDRNAELWVSETTGCRIWHFDPAGNVIEILGAGERGFNANAVPFERARFGSVYAMGVGPDGRIYVLDSTNFAVRRIDPLRRVVETIAGTGKPGPATDGDPLDWPDLAVNQGNNSTALMDCAWMRRAISILQTPITTSSG